MRKFSTINFQRGFSLVELIISMTVLAILLGIVTLNLNTAQQNTTNVSTIDTLIADLSQQQIKAMVGDTEGRSTLDNYGIYFNNATYTLFHGAYSALESTNFSVNLPTTQHFTTTFPGNQVIFLKGSGEISGFTAGQNTITVANTTSGQQKIIQINRYGVITAIN